MSILPDLLAAFITIGIPECLGLAMLMVALLRLRFRWKKILQTGILLATIVLMIRLATVKTIAVPGIHSAIAALALALLVAHFYQISKLKSLTASVIAMFLLNVFEMFTFKLAEHFFHHGIQALDQNKLIWILTNWLHIVLLFLVAFCITRTNWYRRGRAPV